MQMCWGRCEEDLALPYMPLITAFTAQWEQALETPHSTLGPDGALMQQFLYQDTASVPGLTQALTGEMQQDKLRLLRAVSRTSLKLAQQMGGSH